MASPSIHAMKDGDIYATEFPSTTAGLQAAIDYGAGGKVKVFIGPGTLSVTTAISIHGGCHLQGAAKGSTTIQRASGSLTSGDAAYSGNLLMVTPYGSNGTPPANVGQAQNDITISDITLDGNYTAFGAVNPNTPRHMGLYATWSSEIALRNVDISNFLQTGIQFDTCGKVFVTDVYISKPGQYASPSSRNGINFINNQNGLASGYGKFCIIENCIIDSPLDACMDFSDCQDITVKNVETIGGNYVFELEGSTAIGTLMKNFTISNVIATDNTDEFFKVGIFSGVTLKNVTISSCVMDAHATLHVKPAVTLPNDVAVSVDGFYMIGCIFRNINSSNTAAIPFFVSDCSTGTTSQDIWIVNCLFSGGAPASTATNGYGFDFTSDVRRVRIIGCNILDATGVGIRFVPVDGRVQNDVIIRDCLIKDCTNQGIQLLLNSGAGTLSRVLVEGVTVLDPCEQTGTRAVDVGAAVNGSTVSKVTLSGVKVIRTGANPITNGLRLFQTGTSITDDISIELCDFNGCTGPTATSSGAPTNVHMSFRPGRGTDVTAAATIAVPLDGSTFHVIGNTNVTNGITVNPWDNGRTVTLIFEGTPTVSDTGTSKLAGNFVAAGTTNDFDTLTLVCDGTNWTEVCRSAN